MQLQIMELKQSIELHKKHSPPKVVKVLSVSEREEAGDWHIHLRGGIRNLGPVVKRGFLAVATQSVVLRTRYSRGGKRKTATRRLGGIYREPIDSTGLCESSLASPFRTRYRSEYG